MSTSQHIVFVRVLMIAGLQLAALDLPAQQSQWALVAVGNQPPIRSSHAMAYDAARQEVVLFGGDNGLTHLGDTWVWNGVAWSQRAPAYSPIPRHSHAMVYDAARQRVVLFGGGAAASGPTSYLGDTYEWDGANWVPRLSVTMPSPRRQSAMAYDAVRQRCILFGGLISSGAYSAETWEWSGTNWAPRPSASFPSPRGMPGMAYDVARNRTVLAAGHDGSGALVDTWEWDGLSWTQINAIGYTPASQIVWAASTPWGPRVSGLSGFGVDGMRAFDGMSWGAWSPTGAWLNDFRLCYDGARGLFVAFGGLNGASATVVLMGTPSGSSLVGLGCGSPPLQLAPQGAGAPILGATARATLLNAPTPLFAVTAGFDTLAIGQFPLPLPLDGFGMTGCVLRHSADILGLSVTPTGGSLEFALPIPNQSSLLGQFVHLHAYGYAPGQNLAEIVVSNRLDWQIGDV